MNAFLKVSILIAVVSVAVYFVPMFFWRTTEPKEIGGFVAPGWKKVADVFKKQVASGRQRGGALAVYYKGKLVVEFAGGSADDAAHWLWNRETLSQFYSSTKAVSALVMAVLVDRGLLDYAKPVCDYWPEFAENGKEAITVEQLLSHQAGLASIDETFSAYDLLDNEEKLSGILASQTPNWQIGDGIGYHGFTLGLYEDQIVRRVDPTGRSLSQFFQQEVADPFGIDFFIGLPKEENYRCARAYDFEIFSRELFTARRYWPSIWQYLTKPRSHIARQLANPEELTMDGIENNPYYREIPNPSVNGFGTAVGAAMLFAIISNGGVYEGKRLLSESAIAKLEEPLASGKDKVLSMNLTYGRGVTLRQTSQGNYLIGAPGAGGQMLYCDTKHHLSWAYVTNHLSLFAIGDDPKYLELESAIYETLSDVHVVERRNPIS